MRGDRAATLGGAGHSTPVPSEADLLASYRAAARRRNLALLVASVVLGLLVGVSIALGHAGEGALDSIRSFAAALWNWVTFGTVEDLDPTARIVWTIRAPRTLCAVVAGAALAVAGLLTQTTLRNPLASPYTLGVSSAASFGAAVALISGGGLPGLDLLPGDYPLVAHAFVCSSICVMVILLVTKLRGVTSETVILLGVAMMFFFSALTSMVQYLADPDEVAQLVYWMFGSLQRASWTKFWIVTIITVVAVATTRHRVWDLNALGAGDEAAEAVGVDVAATRVRSLLLAALVTAVVVSMFGPIAFIGLVAPHLARLVVGGDHRALVPASCLMGAGLLAGADVVARNVISPAVIPVGIITSFIGVPVLVHLMLRDRMRRWA